MQSICWWTVNGCKQGDTQRCRTVQANGPGKGFYVCRCRYGHRDCACLFEVMALGDEMSMYCLCCVLSEEGPRISIAIKLKDTASGNS